METGAATTRLPCVVCRNGNRAPGETTVPLTRDGTTIIVEHVPAEICDNCGEDYLDLEVVKNLERIMANAIATATRYAVRDYKATAA